MSSVVLAVWQKLKLLVKPALAAGVYAEKLFESLCCEQRYIWEPLSQDRASYRRRYGANAAFGKRGDYLIRTFNVEVEVKCLRTYPSWNGKCHYIPYRDLKRHEKMQQHTGCRVAFAVFERRGRRAKKDSLRMIWLDDILNRRAGTSYFERKKVMLVPQSAMLPGFLLLKG